MMKAGVRGVTLIELMVTIVILSILIAVALPSYQSFILKAKRSDAKVALTDIDTRQEQFYFRANRYAEKLTDLGFASETPLSSEGYYRLSLTTASGGVSYTVTATAEAEVAADTRCRQFILTSSGIRTSKDSEGKTTTDCW